MIRIVDGNLLDATEDVIAHQVNCKGVMGSGVAKAIRDKYPEVFTGYKGFLDMFGEDGSLGKCQFIQARDTERFRVVANLFGQQDYGYDGTQYTNTDKLREALENLKRKCADNGFTVALPYKIGSDRGGANWDEVLQIIDEVFADYFVTLYRLEK